MMNKTGAEDAQQVDIVVDRLHQNGIDHVRFEFLDLSSVARSKVIPARHFKMQTNSGILFPALVFASDTHLNVPTESNIWKKYGWSDMVCYPDLSTFIVLPWVKNTARVFVSAATGVGGEEVTVDPRNILQAQLNNLAKKKLSIYSCFEYEFWLEDEKTRKPVIPEESGYSTIAFAKHHEFLSKVSLNLFDAGINVICSELETERNLFEINMKPSFGMKSADNAATFRTGIKEMAMQNGLIGSFMSKPYPDFEPASGHLNHSLWSVDGKTSKLVDPSRPYGLSDIAEQWIAGLLDHAPALSFLQGPTLNCFDRISASWFNMANATWGFDNRTCAVRVKEIGPEGVYFENRLGTSASNPYISLAATIAAGIDGINRRLHLPPPIPKHLSARDEANVPPGTVNLPTDLETALDVLKKDEVMMNAMGADLADALESVRRFEMTKLVDEDKYSSLRRLYFEYI